MSFRGFGLALAGLMAFTPSAFAQASGIDYANAKPLPLPTITRAPADVMSSKASVDVSVVQEFTAGARGDGLRDLVKLPQSKIAPAPGQIGSQEYGKSQHPFTMAIENRPELDPYRRAGKLFFKQGTSSFICSASMVARGVVITAAHCVSGYGTNKYYSGFEYVPAYSGGDAPYGVWTAAKVYALPAYLKGTSNCAVKGIVCDTDVAVIVLKPNSNGRYAGDSTGWFGYGTGGYSYNSKKLAQITQLGYPASLNDGAEMIRTDSYGFVDTSLSGNTVIGSGQTGGSSGGPWLVNFGFASSPDGSNPVGADPERLIVVGTTSWGYNDNGVTKQQGASFFTAAVVTTLYKKACKFAPAACK